MSVLMWRSCGDYVEANAWTDDEKSKYDRFTAKRLRLEVLERSNIEAMIGAPPGRWWGRRGRGRGNKPDQRCWGVLL